jgi:dTMP kinase
MFLVLEGGEGSGKSTQARLLGEWLTRLGVEHVVTREPGGTGVGEQIRQVLLHGGEVPARTELLLMLAARAAFVDEVVRPALDGGAVVVADRYELSSFAYQGYGRGLPLEQVRAANAMATGGLRPDLTIILDVPPEEGSARRSRAGSGQDRIERAGADFHRSVVEAYRLLALSEPDIVTLTGTGAPEAVHEAITDLLARRYPETFRAGLG